LKEKSSSYK